MTPPEFEWDATKARENLKKHGVAFEEALTVFADPLARIFDDPDHSENEQRELIVGHSAQHVFWLLASQSDNRGRELSAPEKRRRLSGETMKKTVRKPRREIDDVRPEYQFDYSRRSRIGLRRA